MMTKEEAEKAVEILMSCLATTDSECYLEGEKEDGGIMLVRKLLDEVMQRYSLTHTLSEDDLVNYAGNILYHYDTIEEAKNDGWELLEKDERGNDLYIKRFDKTQSI